MSSKVFMVDVVKIGKGFHRNGNAAMENAD
jgi:hypothetical protein